MKEISSKRFGVHILIGYQGLAEHKKHMVPLLHLIHIQRNLR